MPKNTRTHPSSEELADMSNRKLVRYARQEADALMEQKQTAVPRLLLELSRRLSRV